MSESLTRRVGRLVAGSFNALIDAVENAAPEAVMEQAIREIDAALADVRRDLGVVAAQHHLTAKRLADDAARHEELGERAELALRQQREDLAAAAVERQMDLEAQAPVLESRLAELAGDRTRLEGFIAALQAKRREMRDALDGYRQTREPAGAGVIPGASGSLASAAAARAERAGAAFERVFQNRTGLQGTAGTTAEDAARLAELEELSRRHRVEERLARLKAGNP
jgi:phage shock protein A